MGSVEHCTGARLPAEAPTIQSWSKATSEWNGTAGGRQVWLVTPEATPMTAVPSPAMGANIWIRRVAEAGAGVGARRAERIRERETDGLDRVPRRRTT